MVKRATGVPLGAPETASSFTCRPGRSIRTEDCAPRFRTRRKSADVSSPSRLAIFMSMRRRQAGQRVDPVQVDHREPRLERHLTGSPVDIHRKRTDIVGAVLQFDLDAAALDRVVVAEPQELVQVVVPELSTPRTGTPS